MIEHGILWEELLVAQFIQVKIEELLFKLVITKG